MPHRAFLYIRVPRALRRPGWLVWLCGITAVLVVFHSTARPVIAAGQLAAVIDEAVKAGHDGPFAERSSDAEFVRRVHLDLTGTIPAAAEAREFLDDASPDKRARLIDRLLDSPLYARHMQTTFDLMLNERRADKHVSRQEWEEYLRESFAENKPYNVLVREILSSDGTEEKERAAAKFYLDRDAETNLITRDVGRLFFGMDLQCAQCHDHPLVDDFLQKDYYGIYAYLNRSYVFEDKKAKKSYLAEKAEGEVTYKSVFDPETTYSAKPHLPGAQPVDEPQFEKGQEYVVAPADGVRPVPKYSRREEFAAAVTDGTSRRFNRNIANRLWAHMMGRGLVHPLRQDHSDNPPSHPELLDHLADEFAAMNYDIKAYLRELALSETYQRSSVLPADVSAADLPEDRFAVAIIKPLLPEQLAASIMQATGFTTARRDDAVAEMKNADPRFFDILEADEKRRTQQAVLIEEALFGKMTGNINSFVSVFAGLPGTPQNTAESTVHQALFIANGGTVQGLLNPAGTNLMGRVAALEDPAAVAEELYLAIFSRRPSAEELTDVQLLLADRTGEQRTAVLKELAWAMLASSEFRFNH